MFVFSALVSAGIFCASSQAHAGTITVSTNLDTNTRDTVMTFREALLLSNGTLTFAALTVTEQGFVSGTVGAGTADTINFAIVTASKVISVTASTPEPTISDGSTTIDGYTQTGSSVNTNSTGALNTVLVVELNGSAASSGSIITFASSNNLVRGLVIRNARISGITSSSGANNNTVQGNQIGTTLAGTVAAANVNGGVVINGGSGWIIGTNGDGSNDAAERNLISANTQNGVFITSTSSSNIVAGNIIGLNKAGTGDLGNSVSGVRITITSNSNRIGTNGDGVSDDIERNVISGNSTIGIYINDSDSNTIAGNYIGPQVGGTTCSGITSTGSGMRVESGSDNNIIGTDGSNDANNANERNIISCNTEHGVAVDVSGPTGNIIAGNYLGTDVTGAVDLGNTSRGVALAGGALNTRIGTDGNGIADTEERNVISGNNEQGILNIGASNNTIIAGNYIGINAAGTAALPNTSHGIGVNGSTGLRIGTDGSNDAFNTNERNIISGNTSYGIVFESSASSNTVAGNYIGLNAAGTAVVANLFQGIYAYIASNNNVIGTDSDGVADTDERNVISGSSQTGVQIKDSTGTIIAGNYIGTDPTGLLDFGNAFNGILFDNADNGRIGTNGDGVNDVGEGNLISGNDGGGTGVRTPGLYFVTGSTGNTIAGNIIGMNASGTAALGNAYDGITLDTSNNNVVGVNGDGSAGEANEGNLISGNGRWGILNYHSSSNVYAGNIIGLNITGNADFGNTSGGIDVTSSLGIASNNNRFGTNGDGVSDALERNIISGNGGVGINLVDQDQTSTTTGNVVAGNYIGSDITGLLPFGNGGDGIDMYRRFQGTIIGFDGTGTASVERNIIVASGWAGIWMGNSTAFSNNTVIAGNYIGVGADGTTALGNYVGIFVDGFVNDVTIGGDTVAEGNLIANSTGDGGVELIDDPTADVDGIEISHNSIFGNFDMSIDITADVTLYEADGPNPNDVGDGDTNANQGMNYPVITSVSSSGGNTTIVGTLDTASATLATIEVYLTNTAVHATNHGDLKTFIGTATPTNASPGNWSLIIPDASLSPFQLNPAISTIAIDAAGNTSEPSCTWPLPLPDTITNLAGVAGNNKVTLSWSITDDCANISDFVVEYDGGSGYVVFADGVSATTGAVVTGLTNGQAYNFRVAASGTAGTGAYSNIVNVTPIGIPDPIDDLSATAQDTQVVLTWTDPGGSPVTDYVVQYGETTGFPGNALVFVEGSGTMLTAIVTGLTNGTSYSFRVFAVNGVGSSPASNVVSGTPAIIGSNSAPTTPTNLYVDETNAQSGSNNPTAFTSGTPIFSAICNDPNALDVLNQYRIQVDNNNDFSSPVWDSGAVSMSSCNQGSRSVDITYGAAALTLDGTTYYWRIKFWDDELPLGTEGAFSEAIATNFFTLIIPNFAPTAPTNLFTNNFNAQGGSTNPTGITNSTPVFSAICNDSNVGDIMDQYRIQVDDNNDFSSTLWDSGSGGAAMLNCTAGSRSQNISFGGTPLTQDGVTYYWRIKFWDDEVPSGTEGVFSEDPISTNFFTMASVSTGGGTSIQRIEDLNQQNQQQLEEEQAPPAEFAIPVIGPVTVVSPSSVRFEWSYDGTGQIGFRLKDDQGVVVVDAANAGARAATETGLPHNTVVSGRKVVPYDSVQEGIASAAYPDAVTHMILVMPEATARQGHRISVRTQQLVNNLTVAQSGVQFSLIPVEGASSAQIIESPWLQQTTYTFDSTDPSTTYLLRSRGRNQVAIETEWSTTVSIQEGDFMLGASALSVSLALSASDGQSIRQPLNPNTILNGEISLLNGGEATARNVFLTLPIPKYITYIQGTLSIDGTRQSDGADMDFGQAGNNGVAAIWPELAFKAGHTIRFQVGFDTQQLLSDFTQTFAQALAAANPQIVLQAQASHADSETPSFSNQQTIEPNVAALQPQPAPTEQVPAPVLTPDQTKIIEQILEEEFPLPGQPAPENPIPQAETTVSVDGGAFIVTSSLGGQTLSIQGHATANDDQIEFVGTSSAPFTVITLIFNGTVTSIVVSDANGNWQAFVSAEQLGIGEGQDVRVVIEAIAAKGDMRSERVQIGDILVSRALSGVITTDFETQVGGDMVTTFMQQTIAEHEEEIRTTLAVSAPLVIVSSAPLWGYLPYVPTLIYHFFIQFIGFIGWKKRRDSRFYGIAYDSLTKQPLALAIVRIYKLEAALAGATSLGAAAATKQKLVTTVVTDKEGRYEALLEPGTYHLEVAKPGYLFPSQIVTAAVDGDHEHIYNNHRGIEVEDESIVIPDVPLDPVNAKRQWELASGGKKVGMAVQRAGDYLAVPVLLVGSIASALVVITTPGLVSNWIIAGLYILLLSMQLRLRNKIEKAWGVVYDIATDAVLPLTTVQLVEPASSRVVTSRLSDYQGRFSFLPEPGSYVIKATKPGFKQVSEVVEGPQTDRQPLADTIDIDKPNQRISGDLPMRQA